jgi:hypothetical protein
MKYQIQNWDKIISNTSISHFKVSILHFNYFLDRFIISIEIMQYKANIEEIKNIIKYQLEIKNSIIWFIQSY